MSKLKNVHKGRIYKLAWVNGDRSVVLISLYEGKWAVKIVDVVSENVLLSTYVNVMVMGEIYNSVQGGISDINGISGSGDFNNGSNSGCRMINII